VPLNEFRGTPENRRRPAQSPYPGLGGASYAVVAKLADALGLEPGGGPFEGQAPYRFESDLPHTIP
jgi:hypothetical protein